MLLHLSTWAEVEAYLDSSRGIIIPIGSTEQHGPTGLIGTDAIAASAIARGVGEAAHALIGPTINVGMALHHTSFPGHNQPPTADADTCNQGLYHIFGKSGICKIFLH
jgi:creatinine amidohydrolase